MKEGSHCGFTSVSSFQQFRLYNDPWMLASATLGKRTAESKISSYQGLWFQFFTYFFTKLALTFLQNKYKAECFADNSTCSALL